MKKIITLSLICLVFLCGCNANSSKKYSEKQLVNNYGIVAEDIIREMIYQCNIIKKNVVEIDPTEKKERALLNLGHTLGHAIEKYMNFKMLHGECVFIGTVMAGIISKNKGLINEEDLNSITELIKKFNVPKLPLNLDYHKIIMYTKNDKKAIGNKIKFILLNSIGEGIISTDVTEEDMLISIEEYMKNYN